MTRVTSDLVATDIIYLFKLLCPCDMTRIIIPFLSLIVYINIMLYCSTKNTLSGRPGCYPDDDLIIIKKKKKKEDSSTPIKTCLIFTPYCGQTA